MDILISMNIATPKSLDTLKENLESCTAIQSDLCNREIVLQKTLRFSTEAVELLYRLSSDYEHSSIKVLYLQLQIWLKEMFAAAEAEHTHVADPADGMEITECLTRYKRAHLLNEQQAIIVKFHEMTKRVKCLEVSPIEEAIHQMEIEKNEIEDSLDVMMQYMGTMLMERCEWPIKYKTNWKLNEN